MANIRGCDTLGLSTHRTDIKNDCAVSYNSITNHGLDLHLSVLEWSLLSKFSKIVRKSQCMFEVWILDKF